MLINSILGIYMLDFKSIFNARQKAQRALNGVAFFLELILAVIVTILNYVISKLFVFISGSGKKGTK